LPSALRNVFVALVATCAFAGSACGGRHEVVADESTALAEDATDASEAESHAAALSATFTLPSTDLTSGMLVTDASKTQGFFAPTGCLVTTVDTPSATVTHEFKNCAGPWGLLRVNGIVRVTYASMTVDGQSALKLEVTGTGLTLNRATLDYHATAVVFVSGLARRMKYASQLDGKTARGRTLSRTTDWTVAWSVGAACLVVEGSAEGTITGRPLKTTVRGYRRCRGGCPEKGGEIDVLNEKTGASISIHYNGGSSATLTGVHGNPMDFVLACGI
jgi:hypothetical protein